MLSVNIRVRRKTPAVGLLSLMMSVMLIAAACGSSGDAREPAPSNVSLSVSSGNFTTTVRMDGVTTVPFSETILVEAIFEESIYGSAGQTSVFAEVSPTTYRMSSRTPRNNRTYSFALTNRSPGTVEISIYADRDSEPITFEVQVGEE